jgi:hypothetical protein
MKQQYPKIYGFLSNYAYVLLEIVSSYLKYDLKHSNRVYLWVYIYP